MTIRAHAHTTCTRMHETGAPRARRPRRMKPQAAWGTPSANYSHANRKTRCCAPAAQDEAAGGVRHAEARQLGVELRQQLPPVRHEQHAAAGLQEVCAQIKHE